MIPPYSLEAIAALFIVIAGQSSILTVPAPQVVVGELAESSVNIINRPWVATENYWDVYYSLTEKIKLTFDERSISFPFPHRTVHMLQS